MPLAPPEELTAEEVYSIEQKALEYFDLIDYGLTFISPSSFRHFMRYISHLKSQNIDVQFVENKLREIEDTPISDQSRIAQITRSLLSSLYSGLQAETAEEKQFLVEILFLLHKSRDLLFKSINKFGVTLDFNICLYLTEDLMKNIYFMSSEGTIEIYDNYLTGILIPKIITMSESLSVEQYNMNDKDLNSLLYIEQLIKNKFEENELKDDEFKDDELKKYRHNYNEALDTVKINVTKFTVVVKLYDKIRALFEEFKKNDNINLSAMKEEFQDIAREFSSLPDYSITCFNDLFLIEKAFQIIFHILINFKEKIDNELSDQIMSYLWYGDKKVNQVFRYLYDFRIEVGGFKFHNIYTGYDVSEQNLLAVLDEMFREIKEIIIDDKGSDLIPFITYGLIPKINMVADKLAGYSLENENHFNAETLFFQIINYIDEIVQIEKNILISEEGIDKGPALDAAVKKYETPLFYALNKLLAKLADIFYKKISVASRSSCRELAIYMPTDPLFSNQSRYQGKYSLGLFYNNSKSDSTPDKLYFPVKDKRTKNKFYYDFATTFKDFESRCNPTYFRKVLDILMMSMPLNELGVYLDFKLQLEKFILANLDRNHQAYRESILDTYGCMELLPDPRNVLVRKHCQSVLELTGADDIDLSLHQALRKPSRHI